MPLFDPELIKTHAPEVFTRARFAIETGTCFGGSTRVMARAFERVWTIELSPELSVRTSTKMRAQGFSNVEFVHGDSGRELASLLDRAPWGGLSEGEPLVFFLDAHWSGDRTVDWGARTPKGFRGYGADTAHRGRFAAPRSAAPSSEEQNPLLEELHAILTRCKGPALIVIDDLDCLPEQGPGSKDVGFVGEDWSHLSREKVLRSVQSRLVAHWQSRDQWLLLLS